MSSCASCQLQSPQQWPTFQTSDKNKDNQLSLDEFTAAGQNLPGGINGPDAASLKNLFAAIDGNGDGQISRSEAATAVAKLSHALQSQLLGVQEQSASPGRLFAKADADSSGGLSLDEFKAAVTQNLPNGIDTPSDDQLQSLFNRIDSNGDGQISPDELKSAHRRHRHHQVLAAPPTGEQPASATAPAATDAASTAGNTAQNGLNSLLLQAIAAYNSNPSQTTASDLVNQLTSVLTAA